MAFAEGRTDKVGRRIHPGDGSGLHHFDSTAAKFAARHHKTEGCWEWTGHIASTGYGRLGLMYAHRVSWELHNGPIADDLTVDHLCRNRACVNPGHMELVTREENGRRGAIGSSPECKRGHDLTDPTNLYPRSDGTARCRACALIRARRIRATKRAGA